MSSPRPSETFLLVQRLFTFLDEWLFYALLGFLYVNNYMEAFWPVAAIGSTMMVISYVKQWYMEVKRFHSDHQEESNLD